jgi:hypothetical protein
MELELQTDYRRPEHRRAYFDALYRMNLQHGVMPGLVYLYMPELARRYDWDAEQRLWFAVINGCTQHPITSLRIFNRQPQIPQSKQEWAELDSWFNAEWANLAFDADRLKNKRNTLRALFSYAELVETAGSQVSLYSGKSYAECWATASSIYGFGRLSTFSYLEYVKIMGLGPDCTDLMFEDFSGSRSHRNGALFLEGLDRLVYDKRAANGFDGKYEHFGKMCGWLVSRADEYLKTVSHSDAGYFTYESCLCQFKNGFFGRRYPGVYSDMAWERVRWYDERGLSPETEVFKDIRAQRLPAWLRLECESKSASSMKARKEQYMLKGFPYRGEHFLSDKNAL